MDACKDCSELIALKRRLEVFDNVLKDEQKTRGDQLTRIMVVEAELSSFVRKEEFCLVNQDIFDELKRFGRRDRILRSPKMWFAMGVSLGIVSTLVKPYIASVIVGVLSS